MSLCRRMLRRKGWDPGSEFVSTPPRRGHKKRNRGDCRLGCPEFGTCDGVETSHDLDEDAPPWAPFGRCPVAIRRSGIAGVTGAMPIAVWKFCVWNPSGKNGCGFQIGYRCGTGWIFSDSWSPTCCWAWHGCPVRAGRYWSSDRRNEFFEGSRQWFWSRSTLPGLGSERAAVRVRAAP